MLFIRCKQSSADQNADEEVRSYFNLALQFLKPTHPSLVAIGGKSGTGKSVLARYASALIGAPPGPVVLRSDIIRKTLLGVNPLMAGEVATLQEDYDIGKLDWPLIDASDSPYGRLSEARPF